MSNYFLLFSDKSIKSKSLNFEEVSVEEYFKKVLEKPVFYCYKIEPVADIEKTVENEKVPEFYEETNRFFNNLYEICSENLNQGAFLALILTYYGQNFDDVFFEHIDLSIDSFLQRYLNFEFDTIYKLLSQ